MLKQKQRIALHDRLNRMGLEEVRLQFKSGSFNYNHHKDILDWIVLKEREDRLRQAWDQYQKRLNDHLEERKKAYHFKQKKKSRTKLYFTVLFGFLLTVPLFAIIFQFILAS